MFSKSEHNSSHQAWSSLADFAILCLLLILYSLSADFSLHLLQGQSLIAALSQAFRNILSAQEGHLFNVVFRITFPASTFLYYLSRRFSWKRLGIPLLYIFSILNMAAFYLANVVRYIFKTPLTADLLIYVLKNLPYLLGDALPLLRETSPLPHLLLALFSSLTVLTLDKFEERVTPETRGKAKTPEKLILFLICLLISLITLREIKKGFLKINFSGASTRSEIPTRGIHHDYFRSRFGFNLPVNTNVVIFIMESAGQTHIDLEQSQFFRKETSLHTTHFFLPVPHSTSTIYSLMTGLYSSPRTRPAFDDLKRDATLPGILAKRGYTCHFLYSGPAHFESLHQMLTHMGFSIRDKEDMLKKKDPSTGREYKSFSWGVDDRALKNECRMVTKFSASPFFLVVGFSNAHSPYFNPDPSLFHRYDNDISQGRHRNALEYGLSIADSITADIIESHPDTLFLLISDHGESFGEHGSYRHDFSLYNEEIRIPFALYHRKLSGQEPLHSGTVLDLLPTFLDILGIPQVIPVQGQSLFDPAYHLDLHLSSWGNGQSKGIIQEDKKYLYEADSGKIWVMGLSDEDRRVLKRNFMTEMLLKSMMLLK